MNFKSVIRLLVATVLSASFSALSADNNYALEALKKGSWSLQFGIQQNASLTSFAGATISAKRHYSPRSALRTGVTVNFDHGSQSDLRTSRDQTRKRFDTDLGIEYLRYLSPTKRLGAYLGAGPHFSYARDIQELKQQSTASPSYPRTVSREWGLGLDFLLGTEWFVTEGIALFGEYDLYVGYRSALNQASDARLGLTARTKATDYLIASRGAKLGLSLYF
jgi:hypothetical protein